MNDFIPKILPHLWQSTVFGLIIVAAILALPKASARVRYLVGWFGFLKFFLPLGWLGTAMPNLGMMTDAQLIAKIGLRPLLLPEFVVYAHQPATRAAAAPAASAGANVDWISFGLWLWLAVTVIALVGGVARTFWFSRRVVIEAEPFDSIAETRLSALARQIGVNPARVRGYQTDSQMLLGVIGLFRSRILVPRDLMQSLGRDEAEAVLLHELAHVRRRDNLWRLLQAGVVGLFWFHPLVWWLHRRMLWESERACDELVLSAQRNKQAYAGVLLKAARFALGLGVPGVSGMSRMRLQPRIRAILNHQTRKDSAMKTTGLLLLLCGTLAVCAVAAQTPPPTEPTVTDEEGELFKRVIAVFDEAKVVEARQMLLDCLAEEGPHSAAIAFNVANLYVETGNLENAIEYYEKALVEFPHFMRARKLLTIMLAQTKNYSECVESGERYLEEFGDDPDGVIQGLLGLSYLNLKQLEKAVDNYEVAVERAPATTDWKMGLARAYMETERYEACITVVKGMLEKDPTASDLWLYMSDAAVGLGDEGRAAEFMGKAQDLPGVSIASEIPLDPGQFDVAPKTKSRTSPIYPKNLKEQGIYGRAVALFTVTPSGEVTDIQTEPATHSEFESAVQACLKDWTFDPGTKNGEPVSVRMRLPFVFNPVAMAGKPTQ